MPTTFEWVRERLIAEGPRGMCCADVLKEIREAPVPRTGGTYHSFSRSFWCLVQLGYVERTGEIRPAYQRGVEPPVPGIMAYGVFYSISETGINTDPDNWVNPYKTLYPEIANRPPGFWMQYYKPTGRPRGRPRIERVRRRRRAQPEEVSPRPPITAPGFIEPVLEPRAIVPVAPGEGRRVIRVSPSAILQGKLDALRPQVDALQRDASGITELESEFGRILDEALEILEPESPKEVGDPGYVPPPPGREPGRRVFQDELIKVEAIAEKVENASRGFETMRQGLLLMYRARADANEADFNAGGAVYVEGWNEVDICCAK